ncbi:GNAT family N-acetyltransferase [Kiloniella majae]|uniref:GNAT family N-acetyltransferase n=1 Tax=Kiloniella majae TaxID=1938558 RepID=UPI0013029161|nr:GNAT family N-acetyltransferase [Kiloniella majae]
MMDADIVIRFAEQDDMPKIVKMAEEFADYLSGLGEVRAPFDAEVNLAKLIKHGFGTKPLFSALIAEKNSDVLGYAIFSYGFWADSFQGMIFMTDLFVRQDWRSQGVGQAMIEELRRIGRYNDCELLMWTVWKGNPPARKFYDKLGAISLQGETLMALDI